MNAPQLPHSGWAIAATALLPGITEGGELWFTVAGSLSLISGHVMNWRLRPMRPDRMDAGVSYSGAGEPAPARP